MIIDSSAAASLKWAMMKPCAAKLRIYYKINKSSDDTRAFCSFIFSFFVLLRTIMGPFKGIVHPKIKLRSLFTHPGVVITPYDLSWPKVSVSYTVFSLSFCHSLHEAEML